MLTVCIFVCTVSLKMLDEEEPVKQTECTFKLSFIYGLFVMLVMHNYLSGMKWLSNYCLV